MGGKSPLLGKNIIKIKPVTKNFLPSHNTQYVLSVAAALLHLLVGLMFSAMFEKVFILVDN